MCVCVCVRVSVREERAEGVCQVCTPVSVAGCLCVCVRVPVGCGLQERCACRGAGCVCVPGAGVCVGVLGVCVGVCVCYRSGVCV